MESNIVPLSSIPTVHQLYNPFQTTPLTLQTCTRPLRPAARGLNDRVSLYKGDITTLRIDAIVNASNIGLRPGGGVDAAIHRAAGPGLRNELRALGRGCATGQSVLSMGHRLPARYVIHTVGPVYTNKITNGGSGEADPSPVQLMSCYRTALDVAIQHDIKTVAFPCISTGVYGYPPAQAAKVACETVRSCLELRSADSIERVIFCCFEERDIIEYKRILPKYFPNVIGT